MPRIELTKLHDVEPLGEDIWRWLSFDASGTLLLSWVDPLGTLFARDFGVLPAAQAFEGLRFRYPKVQRFADGRWLVVDSRCQDGQTNGRLFAHNAKLIADICLEDAIRDIVVDGQNQIWVGYFDENPTGLRAFNAQGHVFYDFNASTDLDIYELYAMHLEQSGGLWVYAFEDFFLARVARGRVEVVLDSCPVEGARAILADGRYCAFLGNYDDDRVFVLDLRSKDGCFVELSVDGSLVQRPLLATRGHRAAFLHRYAIYELTLDDLVAAAGML
ncbi:MAG: hypothetical protein AAGD04_10070 [Pseudomonadota bacterium]